MLNEDDNTIVIIGAGVAGIAAAIRLRHQGYAVVVLEKTSDFGGKLGTFSWEDYRWDKGPSLFTAPELVDDLFYLVGKNPRDYFNYKTSQVACNYFFSNETSLKFTKDKIKLKEEISSKISTVEADSIIDYLAESEKTYKNIGDFFIDHKQFGWKDSLKFKVVKRYPHLLSAKLRKSLHQYNASKFSDKRVIQIFDRYGTYNGSNPYKMSGLYSMIPHLEMNQGTFFPEGGMRSIADSLYKLALKIGVKFHFNQTIQLIESLPNHEYSVITAAEKYHATKLICAIDHLTFYKDVLKNKILFDKYKTQERSSSALVYYWAVETVIPTLDLHNIFFSDDYQKEFESIFNTKNLPKDFTIYIHISSVINSDDAPSNGQNLFVMVNTPAGLVPTDVQKNKIRETIIQTIAKQTSVDISTKIKYEKTWDSKGIEEDNGAFMGALYGASSNGKLAALKRHGNQIKQYPNLYFCGGTVHPGGGIPLALKSAKIVSNLIHHEK